jgi:pyridoxamine 5'-phosphate oxidase
MNGPRLETLPAVEDAIWRELGRAVRTKGHGWRVGVLATVDRGAADARSVVLRDLDLQSRALLIYTDSRSAKAQQVQAQPQGKLVLWSEVLGWQLRLSVALSLETSGLRVSSRWAQLKLTPAAHDYLSPLPPGSVLSQGTPTPERNSRDHFAVVAARVDAVDWLELHPEGHRRARFDAAGGAWLTP